MAGNCSGSSCLCLLCSDWSRCGYRFVLPHFLFSICFAHVRPTVAVISTSLGELRGPPEPSSEDALRTPSYDIHPNCILQLCRRCQQSTKTYFPPFDFYQDTIFFLVIALALGHLPTRLYHLCRLSFFGTRNQRGAFTWGGVVDYESTDHRASSSVALNGEPPR